MKLIKMMTARAGEGIINKIGDELEVGVDVDEDEAQRMVENHLAIDISPVQKRKAVAKKKAAKKAVKK
jgi:hypothetical protein